MVSGKGNTVNCGCSVVTGASNTLNKDYSAVFGYKHNVTGSGALVAGGIAEGEQGTTAGNTASATNAVAFGASNTASGLASIVMSGWLNTAGGSASVVGNSNNTVSLGHNQTTVFGYNNNSSRSRQLVCGEFCASDANASLVVGNGANANNRSNSFAIRYDGSMVLSGHKITVSTTAPGNPSAGDIWFDIN